MKLIIKALLLFLTHSIFADFEFEGELQFNKPYLFVSLGCNCWQAQALRVHELRNAAFPFDWLISHNNDKLVKCLDEKFKYFTEESCFKRDETVTTNLDNVYYDLKFSHDWPFSGGEITEARHKEQLESIKKKYVRRIVRKNYYKELKEFLFINNMINFKS